MSATRKLTQHDADTIRDIHEWKKQEIDRINSIGSARALAKKFDVSIRAIESVLSYRTHRGQL